MTRVPTLHVRNVPIELYDELRARAAREGRSIGAETLAILRTTLERDAEAKGLLARLDALRSSIRLPADAPVPEELIREGRDERSRGT